MTSSDRLTTRELVLLKATILVAVGLWIFSPAFNGDWIWDDSMLVKDNETLRSLAGLGRIWFAAPATDYWPLTWTLLWIEWHLWGAHTLGYHLCSVALHLTSAFLIWRLLDKLGLRWGWLGGLIFVVHPLVVESVAWISEIKNTLSLPFFLLSLNAYIDTDQGVGKRGYGRALLFYLLAMLCKSSVVMLPVVLALVPVPVVVRARSATSDPTCTAHEIDEGIEPVGLQGVAGAGAVPGRLPAALGFGLEAGCDPGELDLVTEEPASDAAVFVLSPTEVAVGVDPGPPEALVLAASGRGPHRGGSVAHLAMRRPLVEELQQFAGGPGDLAQGVGHHAQLRTGELPLVEGLGQEGVLGRPFGRRQAPLGRPLRGARELPQPLGRRAVALFGELPGLDHLWGVQGHPRGGGPLGLTEQPDELAGRSTGEPGGDGTPHYVTDEPHGLLDIGE